MVKLGGLFVDVSRYHSGAIHQAVSKLKVGRGMPPVLGYICQNNGCMQSEISRINHVSPATATVMLQSMEKNGLIVRRSAEDDQRCMRIYITDEGRKIAELGKETVERVDDEFFSVLSDEEHERLAEILIKLKDRHEKEIRGKEKSE